MDCRELPLPLVERNTHQVATLRIASIALTWLCSVSRNLLSSFSFPAHSNLLRLLVTSLLIFPILPFGFGTFVVDLSSKWPLYLSRVFRISCKVLTQF